MLRNHLKIALRNLSKNRLFAALNISGLAIGLAASLLLALYVHDEWSYDRFHEHADRIVRVVFRADINGGKIREPFAMPPTAAALRNEYPEVQDAVRLRVGGSPTLLNHGNTFRGARFASADAHFFQMFTLPLQKGDAQTALTEPNTVVVSKTWAERLFGSEDPIGKTLTFKGGEKTYRITGVMKDLPANSHFQFDLLGSMSSLAEAQSDSWMQSEFYTYLLLPPGYDYRQLEAKLPQAVEKYMGPQFQAGLGMSLAAFKNKGNQIGLFLQPLTDIHLHSDFPFDLSPSGDVRYVWMFGAVALFILLIACINFMNLSTAGATNRAREVGVRKSVGSSTASLIQQFLTESVLMTTISFVLALGLVRLALPVFQHLTGKQLDLSFATRPEFAAGLLGFGLLVGLLAGSYPAFFLSRFKPVAVLKGLPVRTGGHAGLRNSLVVLQFVISVGLMIATTIVSRQLSFIQEKKLGYDKESLLVLENTGLLGRGETALRADLMQDPRVVNVTTSAFKPVGPSYNNNTMVYPDDHSSQLMKTVRYGVDEQYLPTLGMHLVSGRNFSSAFPTDSTAIIINQTAAKAFGWGQDAVGHTLTRAVNQAGSITYQVIGVVEDFHFKSLHESIAPLLMTLESTPGLIVKVKTAEAAGLLASIQDKWTQLQADEPLAYAFMDDYFQKTYESEQKTGLLMSIFAGLTIFIACLGLFGLATFTAERRTKEIGIRKVLGASAAGITSLLARDFLKLVVAAFFIASPIAWWTMNKWLADFAYRIEIKGWMFLMVGLIAVLVALMTVGVQSVRAALANPVKSLKSE